MITYLWQMERAKSNYRVQTDDKETADKLKRRNGFTLIGNSLNAKKLWVYSCEFTRPDIAKKTLKSVTGKNPKIDSEGLISYE